MVGTHDTQSLDIADGSSAWLNTAWRKRKRIVVPGDVIPGELTDFPLLVALDGDADIGQYARDDGHDVRFTSEDGVTALPHERVVHQRILRDQGVWTIWTGPRAVRYVGVHDRTYVAYFTTNQGWWISAYDHDTNEWRHHQLRSHEASEDGRWWDDHNNPAITVRSDARIVVVYGEHSTERSWCHISSEPESIDAWNDAIAFEQEQRIARRQQRSVRFFASRVRAKLTGGTRPRRYEAAYSYANLYTFPDGTLWRQYRPLRTWSGLSRRPSFVTSEDGGETWSEPVRFIEEEGRTPYLVTAQLGDRIHLLFTDAHPDEWDRSSIYHAYYDHTDRTYRRSDGSLIGHVDSGPIRPADATQVFDGTTQAGEGWVFDVGVDAAGNVVGLFNVYSGETKGLPSHRVHDYMYAHWDCRRWATYPITSETDVFSSGQQRYSGGFVVDREDLGTVYVAHVDPDDPESGFTRHLWRYRTTDHGQTWSRTRISNAGQGKAHSRPVVPINRHDDLPVLWQYGHYVNYLEYHTAIVTQGHGDVIESQHHVKIPRLCEGQDLVLYVYYDNPEAADQSTDAAEVWPPSCLLRYRGTLTQNDLRVAATAGRSSVTWELNATWASDRKGQGEVPIVCEGTGGRGGIWIGKTAQQQLETRVMTNVGQRRQVFGDLVLRTRDWRDATTPPRRSIIQVVFDADNGVRARLDGRTSDHLGEMMAPIAGEDGQTLRVGYAPGRENERFQGWVEAIRLYEGVLSDAWLRMSHIAEREHGGLLRLETPEDAPRSVG